MITEQQIEKFNTKYHLEQRISNIIELNRIEITDPKTFETDEITHITTDYSNAIIKYNIIDKQTDKILQYNASIEKVKTFIASL